MYTGGAHKSAETFLDLVAHMESSASSWVNSSVTSGGEQRPELSSWSELRSVVSAAIVCGDPSGDSGGAAPWEGTRRQK